MVLHPDFPESPHAGLARARAYARTKLRLWAVRYGVALGVLAVIHWSGLGGWWASVVRQVTDNPWLEVALFAVGFGLLFGLIDLPFRWHSGFTVEHRYGLSTQSAAGWWIDRAKAAGLEIVLGGLVVETFYVVLRAFPDIWWLVLWALWWVYAVALAKLFPVVILPMFFPLQPFTDETLAPRLRALAERCGVRAVGLYTIALGRKTKKANAAVVGLGRTRRIILGDTLLSRFSPEEIEVVLGHECGHHRLRHMWKGLAAGSVVSLIGFWALARALPWCVERYGWSGIADVSGLPLISLLASAYALLSMPLENGVSRWFEREADRFALDLTRDVRAFVSCMQKLAAQNLSDPSPSPLVEFWLYDHPSIPRRIRFAERYTLPVTP